MHNFFTFFMLFILFSKITAVSDNVTIHVIYAPMQTLQFKGNLTTDEIPEEATIPMATVVCDNKFSVDVVKYDKNQNNNEGENHQLQRLSRLAIEASHQIAECVSCVGSGLTRNDDVCYSGEALGRAKCADAEACFTELNPLYIRRGCMLPSSINRTFVCKCPLCNDKPAGDVTYYEYKTINDWQFDNERLEEPILGVELLCKVCETTGRSRVADKICMNGSKADYVLCGHNQLCFTNINQQTDYVSRGCIEPPAFNSMYLFCNFSLACNMSPFENPARIKRAVLEAKFVEMGKQLKSFATSTTITTDLIFMALCFYTILR